MLKNNILYKKYNNNIYNDIVNKVVREGMIMNIGFYFCIILVPCFAIMGLLFAVLKEKSAKIVSGFNALSKEEQSMYDKAYIAKDMRNACFLWTAIMLIGSLLSYFLTSYFAIAAYIVWGILFFKDVHIDAEKAFEKYLIKNND